MATKIISLLTVICSIAVKVFDILAAKGKTDDKKNRINKYINASNRLFSDDK